MSGNKLLCDVERAIALKWLGITEQLHILDGECNLIRLGDIKLFDSDLSGHSAARLALMRYEAR